MLLIIGLRSGKTKIAYCVTLKMASEKVEVRWLIYLSLTSLIETRKLKFTALIDVTKAYDSINRELLFRKISGVGITGRVHKAITSLYDNVKCCVRLNGLF